MRAYGGGAGRAAALLAAATVVAAALTSCSAAEEPRSTPSATPVAPASPLAAYDTDTVVIARAGFCDRVSPTGVEAALDGAPTKDDTWANGDPPPGGDVGQEYGCEWSRDGTTARAWVFAPPVTVEQARRYAGEEVGQKCSRLDDQPAFGKPGTAMSCGLNTGDRLVRFAGLFGDAWLTCELQSHEEDPPGPAVVDRAKDWCVQVLEAARA